MNYYPAYLNLKGKKVVVVGGGKVAERKIISLIKSGADITVVSPSLTGRLQQEKKEKRIRHLSHTYRNSDLKEAFLVIAATDSPEMNTKVAEDAPALVNVVDVPSLCNFIAPSIIKRGSLIIAVSTSGASPAISKAVRKELQKIYGSEFSGFLAFIKKIRGKAMTDIKEKSKREKFLKSLASENILNTLRLKGLKAVKKTILERFERLKNYSV